MKDFEPSTLWPIGAFEQARNSGRLGAGQDDRPTLLPTTLLADLQQLHKDPANDDVLEVIAACVRNREAALLYLEHGRHVWPVTIFPREHVYHSPREVSLMAGAGMSTLRVISAEPPGVKPPGDAMHERIARSDRYHPLSAFLWGVALQGPRSTLLTEISGRVAYRLVSSSAEDLPHSLGALSSAVAPAAQRRRVAARHRRLAGAQRRARQPPAQRALPHRRADGLAQPSGGAQRAARLARLAGAAPLAPRRRA